MEKDLAKELYIHDFKIGDNESVSQTVLVSMNKCGFLNDVKYVRHDVHESLEAKLKEAIEFIVKYYGKHAVNCECCMCQELEKIKAK